MRFHLSAALQHICRALQQLQGPCHCRFEGVPSTDEMVIATGTEIGGLLVDGLGDGVLIEFPQEDLSLLRVMSFGLLQACPENRFRLHQVVRCLRCRRRRMGLLPRGSPVWWSPPCSGLCLPCIRLCCSERHQKPAMAAFPAGLRLLQAEKQVCA